MTIEELIALLKRDSPSAIRKENDLTQFCKTSVGLYEEAVGQLIAPVRPVWDASELALAMREGAKGGKHIDFDHVSPKDYKVFMMYRKFGFGGLEATIEKIGPRKTFAIARLVTRFADIPGGMVPFPSSVRAWLNRVFSRVWATARQLPAALEIHCIGPKTRGQIDRATWVRDLIPARHEKILPDPRSPCTLYVPDVHVLVYGPPPQLTRRWLFGTRKQWHPTECLAELVWALALVDTYPQSGFNTLFSHPDNSKKYKTITRGLHNVRGSIRATAKYLDRHGAIAAARCLRDIIAAGDS